MCLWEGGSTLGNEIWRIADDGRGSDGSVAAGGRQIGSRYHQILEPFASLAPSM